MTSRRFAPLFWCQFFSAFNDNFLKNALVFLILFKVAGSNAEALVTLAGAVFIGPFFLLSGIGGELADRYDKAVLARRLKLAEIGAAGLAVVGFWLHSLPVLFAALFSFGTIAALFGPIKYGILPEHLRRAELPAGNALVEAATFLAILLGTVAGGYAARGGGDPASFGGLVIGFAVLCWAASLLIPRTGEAAPDLRVDPNILRSTGRAAARPLGRCAAVARRRHRVLVLARRRGDAVDPAAAGQEPARRHRGGRDRAARRVLGRHRRRLGPRLMARERTHRAACRRAVGALLMGAFGLDLAYAVYHAAPSMPPVGARAFFARSDGLRIAIDFAGLAISGGLFIVPSFAAVQAWAGADRRARVIAAVNVLSAAFMVAGALVTAGLQKAGVTLPTIVAALGVANVVAGLIIFRTLPTSPFRDFLSILFRAFYRLEVKGLENVAKAGPNAIVALNHVSFLDAALALSLLDQEPVFAIDHGIAQRWWVRPFLKITRAMPLDPAKPMATRTLINAVKGGETLIIFPEGRLTVTGSLMKVYDGAGLIADKTDAMVLPVKIEGLERTFFSRLSREQVRRRWWPKVTVTMLEPVRLTIDPALKGRNRRQAAGAALYQIMSDLVFRTTSTDRTVFEAVVEAAATAWLAPGRGRGPDHRIADLQAAARRRERARPQAHPARRGGQGARRHAAERERRRRDDPRRDVGRPRAGDDQLHGRRREHPRRLQGGRDRDHRHLARLRREGEARAARRRARRDGAGRLSRGRPGRRSASSTSCAASPRSRSRSSGATPATRPRSSSPRARRARRRASCSPTATCWRTRRRRRRGSISAAPTRSSTSCRCSTPSG